MLGGAPGQNPVESDYTMAYSQRVNLLDECRLKKDEIISLEFGPAPLLFWKRPNPDPDFEN